MLGSTSPAVSRLRRTAFRHGWWMAGPLLTFFPTVVVLGRSSIWEDEAATVVAISRPALDVITLARTIDAPHAAYYFFLHLWTALVGVTEFWLRFPSLVAVSIAAGIVSLVAAQLAGRRAGLIAGVTFALLPAVALYGSMARPYAFVILFAALSLLTARLAFTRGGWGWWTAHLVTLVVLVYANVLALAFVIGVGVYMLAGRDLRRFATWSACFATTVLIAAPLIYLTREQAAFQAWVLPTTLLDIPVVFGQTAAASPLVAALIVGAGLAVASFRHREILVWATLIVPPIILGIASVVFYPTLLGRYLLVIIPPLAVLAGISLVRMRVRWAAVAILALLVVAAFPERQARFDATYYVADFRSGASLVTSQLQPGDAIVYGDGGAYRNGFEYYFGNGPQPFDVLLRSSAAEVGSIYAAELPDTELLAQTDGYSRIWFVTPYPDTPRYRQLAESFDEGVTQTVNGMTITLFSR